MTQAVPVLQVTGLSKSFGAVIVAKEIDLSISMGECIGVIGPNGAGKSSVFSLIAGVLRPNGGTITLNGHDLTINMSGEQNIKAAGNITMKGQKILEN